MRIAFVSHEFPPDTGGGGIGTYLEQITRMLAERGHDVTVFAGARGETATSHATPAGVEVHRVPAADGISFREAVVPPLSRAHAARPFDVAEGNDFDASLLAVRKALPRLPCVVKLHTPRFAIDELHHRAPTFGQRLRMHLGAWRRGRRFIKTSHRDSPQAHAEIAMIADADELAAPSLAIAESALQWASVPAERLSVFPYPFEPAKALLDIPADTDTRRVTFVGRLEERKGVLDLAAAIPSVLKKRPDVRFRFIGRAMPSPRRGVDMRAYLERQLRPFSGSIEFTGALPPSDVARALAETDVLVAPSHWESFGIVCCEGMAAARAVIGGANGGMSEILGQGRFGVLVPPRSPGQLAAEIVDLINAPERRRTLGEAARQQVLAHYCADRVVPQQLASYARAIAANRARHS